MSTANRCDFSAPRFKATGASGNIMLLWTAVSRGISVRTNVGVQTEREKEREGWGEAEREREE